MTNAPARAEIVVDLDAIAANTAVLRRAGPPPADGGGQGRRLRTRAGPVRTGRPGRRRDALGVAVLDEALALRAAGVTAPVLAWLTAPGEPTTPPPSPPTSTCRSARDWLLEVIAARRRPPAARRGCTSRSTRGSPAAARRRTTGPRWSPRRRGRRPRAPSRVVGLWSHMAYADAPTHPTIGAQVRVFEEAVAVARGAGLTDARRHLANSAATVAAARHLVRPRPARRRPLRPRPARRRPGGDHGLRPAMTVRATVALTKRVPAGQSASRTATRTSRAARDDAGARAGRLRRRRAPRRGEPGPGPRRRRAADDRRAGLHGPVRARRRGRRGRRRRRGRPLGPGERGEPTAQQWADAVDTIHYELVTRVGGASPAATSARPGRSDGAHPEGSAQPLQWAHRRRARGRARPRRRRHRRRRGGHPCRSASRPGGRARREIARRRPAAGGRPARWRGPPGRPDGARAGRRRGAPVGGGDRPAGRAADRRLRARLLAVDGVLGVPAADTRRRAGDRQRPSPGRAAGVLRPAGPRRLPPGGGRPVDDRAAGARPGHGDRGAGAAGPGRPGRALDGRHDGHGAGGRSGRSCSGRRSWGWR